MRGRAGKCTSSERIKFVISPIGSIIYKYQPGNHTLKRAGVGKNTGKFTVRNVAAKKEAILQDLIKNLPQLQDNVEKDGLTYYMYPGDKCVMCDHPSLFISRPEREPHSIIIYGRNGSMVGAYYVKNCWRCNTQHFPAYVEFEDGAAVKTRRYYNGEVPYFHVSADTFFYGGLAGGGHS